MSFAGPGGPSCGETTLDATRLPSEPSGIVLFLDGPIARADIPGICERVRAALGQSDADPVVCDVGALVEPDAVAVDVIARLELIARRLGRHIHFRRVCGELEELLTLTGLRDVIALRADLRVEARRKTEEREQLLRVEEEVEPGDPAV